MRFPALIVTAILSFASVAHAASLEVSEGWMPQPASKNVGAGYATLQNISSEPLVITGVKSPASFIAELHSHTTEDGVMKMRKLESFSLPAGGKMKFKPHGYHLMFFDFKEMPEVGSTFEVTWELENGESVNSTFTVTPRE